MNGRDHRGAAASYSDSPAAAAAAATAAAAVAAAAAGDVHGRRPESAHVHAHRESVRNTFDPAPA
jgi:hypothetical protein